MRLIAEQRVGRAIRTPTANDDSIYVHRTYPWHVCASAIDQVEKCSVHGCTLQEYVI